MTEGSKPKRRISIWPILIGGAFASCIVMNTISSFFQSGAFQPWTSLASPPARATTIIDADPRQIWIETQDRQYFTCPLDFAGMQLCPKWQVIPHESNLPNIHSYTARGSDCQDLQAGLFPFNPKGQVVECVYANETEPDRGEGTYFALMKDGSLQYWQYFGNLPEQRIFDFILDTFVIPVLVVIIISIVYGIFYGIKQFKQKREDT